MLDKVHQLGTQKNSKTLPLITQSNQGVAATYILLESGLKGTKLQYGGGTMVAGNVPSTQQLKSKEKKTGKGKSSQNELDSKLEGKVFNAVDPRIKERKATNKGIKIITRDNKEYGLDDIPSNLKAGPPRAAIEAGKRRALAKDEGFSNEWQDTVQVKKDEVSSWTLKVDPKTGAVTNVNTGKKLDSVKDKKLINKAQLKSGYMRYIKVKVNGKDYAVVPAKGRVINITPGSKSMGVAIKKTSDLYNKAMMAAANKKLVTLEKEKVEIPSLEEAVEIVQRLEENVTVSREEVEPKVEETTPEKVEEKPTEETEDQIEETLEEEEVEERSLSGTYDLITPQKKKFVDWWNSLNEEQKINITEKAMGRFGAISAMKALELLDARKIEVNDKLIENLKCYI